MKTLAMVIGAEVATMAYLLGAMLLAEIDFVGIAAVIAAIGSAVAAIYAAKAHASAVQTKADVVVVKEDIRKVEVATNSMKDALVKSTALASGLEGEAKGRADQKAAMIVEERQVKADKIIDAEKVDIKAESVQVTKEEPAP